MKTIRKRMLEDLHNAQADPAQCLTDLNEDGSFRSIAYFTDKKDTWHPVKHLDNILLMQAAAYSKGNKFYQNPELIHGIKQAIHYWITQDFYCDWNGWWNDLGSGPKIADILLYPNEGIPEDSLALLMKKLYAMTCFDDSKKQKTGEHAIKSSGGNLTDLVLHSLKYAVLKCDAEGIHFLRRLMENELRPFPAAKLPGRRWDVEGIKADMSFQQHYELLYIGGYGEVFADGMNRFIRYTTGTQFALSSQALNFYQDFLLDGMQYAMRSGYRDINASGRGIVRQGELLGIYSQISEGCRILLHTDVPLSRKDELQAFLSNRQCTADQGAGGHKYFWNSDYQVYNGPGYMASVRAASRRTKNSETLNGENVLGHYLGAGATMYYVNGNEYFNILPLWNWNRLPGTTAIQGYLPYGDDKTYARMGKSSFVGGVSTGKEGMSCLDYNDNKMKAKKAWFMFEEGVICLGAAIFGRGNGPVYTCINQTLLRGEILYSTEGNIERLDIAEHTGVFDWVYNNGVGYITAAPVLIQAGSRTGDWKTISQRVDKQMHTDSVLELNIAHGHRPKKDQYAYTVLLNTSPEKLQAFACCPTLHILSNNKRCQAVWNEKKQTLLAVFWKKGSCQMPGGETVWVDRGCTLICQRNGKCYEVFVNHPKQKTGRLKIGIGNRTGEVNFDCGMYAGQTKVIIL